ncbi:MAG: protein kinase [Deltaproteobacteria bacterium]|nr:protein kinase [Deltaproteobacteria bacterium]
MTERNSWEQTLGGALSPGDVIAGKYRVQRIIGRGGMGVVILAWHLDFDEAVAIKLLLPEVLSNTEAVARFEREARANFRIKGEHVAHVLDVGKTEAGAPYMVMEYLDGCDLADVLARDKRLPVGDAVDYILQACDAVAEAHAQGIVHRDLKPENLFVTKRPDGSACIKVLDFGLSKLHGGDERERMLTGTFQLMGTPHYMSPEQWASLSDVGPSSDLWALAVILYELIAGVPPFRGDKLMEICSKILDGEPTPIATYCKDLPAALEAAIFACLRKAPKDRLANVGDFAVKLHPFARREGKLAAKRASGVLRTAGIEVDGVIPSTTIVPPLSIDGEGLAFERTGEADAASQVRRAHAILALAERTRQSRPGADEPPAGSPLPLAVEASLPERVSVATLVLNEGELGFEGSAPSETPPLVRAVPGTKATAPDPRARLDTPTTAYEIGRRSIPDGVSAAVEVTTGADGDTTQPRAAEAAGGADAGELPDAGATSPWATVPTPPEEAFDPAAVWGPVGAARSSPRGEREKASESGLGSTRVIERPSSALERRRKRHGWWFALVVVLGVTAGGLAVALAVQVLGRSPVDADSTASVAPPPPNRGVLVDPVPLLTSTASARATVPVPARPWLPSNGSPQPVGSVVGSGTTQASPSSRPDGDKQPRPAIPTTIE